MKKRFSAMLAALLLLPTASLPGERLMRLSPFADRTASNLAPATAVNLWPLFYHNREFTSVLWPMIDVDARGFAVRPFYSSDDREHAILFPLSCWNTASGCGWGLNTYWTPSNYGSVPLFHFGPEFSYILPVWWKKNHRDFYCGIPGTCFSSGLNFVGPIWTDFDSSARFGLFPFYYQNALYRSYLFPLYDFQSNPPESYCFDLVFGALGRLARNREKGTGHNRLLNGFYCYDPESSSSGFIPLYYYSSNRERRLLITPLAGYGWKRDHGDAFLQNVLGPVFIRLNTPEEKFFSLFWPLYFQSERAEDSDTVALPLFWYRRGQSSSLLSCFGPLYVRHRRTDATSHHLLWPLTGLTSNRAQNRTSWYCWPLAEWRSRVPALIMNEDHFFSLLGPLGYFRTDIPNRSVIGQLLLPGLQQGFADPLRVTLPQRPVSGFEPCQGWAESGSETWLLLSRFIRRRYLLWNAGINPAPVRELDRNLNRLDQIRRAMEHSATQAKPPDQRERLAAELNRTEAATAAAIRKIDRELPIPQNPQESRDLRLAVRERYCHRSEFIRFDLPLLSFRYRSLGNNYDWHLLYLLAEGKRQEQYRRVAVLKYLFRHEATADRTSLTVFPFITWETGPEQRRFAFLWRAVEFSRTHEGWSGHLMFIPF